MPVNPDYKDLFHHLNSVEARYLLVGAYAVIYHTEPRYTKDVDVWVEPSADNAQKVYRALQNFGAPLGDLTVRDLVNPKMVFQMVEPNRIDILTGVAGIDFQKAWSERCPDVYGGEKVNVLDLKSTIRAKKKAGRPRDRIDLEVLSLAAKMKEKRRRRRLRKLR